MKRLKYTITNNSKDTKKIKGITTSINVDGADNFVENSNPDVEIASGANYSFYSSINEDLISNVTKTDFFVRYENIQNLDYMTVTAENVLGKSKLYIKRYDVIEGINVSSDVFKLVRNEYRWFEDPTSVYYLTVVDNCIYMVHTDNWGTALETLLYTSTDGVKFYPVDDADIWTKVDDNYYFIASLPNTVTAEQYNIEESIFNLNSLGSYSDIVTVYKNDTGIPNYYEPVTVDNIMNADEFYFKYHTQLDGSEIVPQGSSNPYLKLELNNNNASRLYDMYLENNRLTIKNVRSGSTLYTSNDNGATYTPGTSDPYMSFFCLGGSRPTYNYSTTINEDGFVKMSLAYKINSNTFNMSTFKLDLTNLGKYKDDLLYIYTGPDKDYTAKSNTQPFYNNLTIKHALFEGVISFEEGTNDNGKCVDVYLNVTKLKRPIAIRSIRLFVENDDDPEGLWNSGASLNIRNLGKIRITGHNEDYSGKVWKEEYKGNNSYVRMTLGIPAPVEMTPLDSSSFEAPKSLAFKKEGFIKTNMSDMFMIEITNDETYDHVFSVDFYSSDDFAITYMVNGVEKTETLYTLQNYDYDTETATFAVNENCSLWQGIDNGDYLIIKYDSPGDFGGFMAEGISSINNETNPNVIMCPEDDDRYKM